MGGIKYYQLAKGEELPDEFCAVRDIGGEPSEYTFYVPEVENAKLKEELEAVGTAAYLYGRSDLKIENAKLRELLKDSILLLDETCDTYYESDYHTIVDRACKLGIEVDG